jgi:hypothetical protein
VLLRIAFSRLQNPTLCSAFLVPLGGPDAGGTYVRGAVSWAWPRPAGNPNPLRCTLTTMRIGTCGAVLVGSPRVPLGRPFERLTLRFLATAARDARSSFHRAG